MNMCTYFKCSLLLFIPYVVVLTIFTHTHVAPGLFGKNPAVWPQVVAKIDTKPRTFSLSSPLVLASPVAAAATYDQATSYIAVDGATGEVIAKKQSSAQLPIASLTKVMSAVVALDIFKPQDEITISEASSTIEPTVIGVVPGQKMRVDELLHAMLMTSANDAAQAVADGTNALYGENVFVKAMNEKARYLGLSQTQFANPQGFDDAKNKSSVHDLALLAMYALHSYPVIATIAQKEFVHLPENGQHKQFDLYNWNGLLGVYPGVIGLKIGNTNDAAYTTIVSATREGHQVLVVLLGAPGILQRDLWTSQLLDDAFSEKYNLPPLQITSSELRNKYESWQQK